MATKRKPAATPPAPSEAQKARATGLRGLIREIASGVRPAGAPPKSPREFTDEAARRKWEAERKKRKG